ncbi:IS200/IS605 family transposase [Sphaerisporangium sp. NPDC051011]|uniref:IS200/IS605 family transposase n=1 Tax=Sphaerisporangium sp. NPDC051011 TaxID=3155792 RepID=UPI00340322B7
MGRECSQTRCRPAARRSCGRCARTSRSSCVEFNGEHDHVHLLIHHPPKVALSKLVNSLKGVSVRLLRKAYAAHVRKFLWGGHFWSGSYFAGSAGGAPLTVLKQYIEQQ